VTDTARARHRAGPPAAPPVTAPRQRGLSLAHRFMLTNLAVVVVASIGIAAWVGAQVEQTVLDRTSAVTALYIESFIEPQVQSLRTQPRLSTEEIAALHALLQDTALGDDVVSFRVWSSQGEILYSPVPSLIGQRFEVEERLQQAFDGRVSVDISDLSGDENVWERQHWDRLVEIYVPVRERGSGRIIASAEFYELPGELEAEISSARFRSWLIVAAVAVASYLVLAGLVKRGSDTIARQDRQLRDQVSQLLVASDQNRLLHDRVSRAAERSMRLQALERRRIGSDLHDGPAQELALALLRLDALRGVDVDTRDEADFDVVHRAVTDALADTRSIAADLRVPELTDLPVEEVVRRAIRDTAARGGTQAELAVDDVDDEVRLPVRIALFRCLQEALSNATRHAPGAATAVRCRQVGDELVVEVSDDGPGFDPSQVDSSTHLGLAGMRERTELLGGTFEIQSRLGHGTTVRMRWPLTPGATM
jgi:signal transduction histidine kinase